MAEDSTGNEFEKLFHRLMELSHPQYMPIRTSGNIGDLGGDGLCSGCRTLYACYAPETFKIGKVQEKFLGDLESATIQRPEQFDKFVFVHNDQRGIHPAISGLIAQQQAVRPTRLYQMGPRKLWYEALELSLSKMEALLQEAIPIQEVRYGVGMADIEPLLQHLSEERSKYVPTEEIPMPTPFKADYNRLSRRAQQILQSSRPYIYQVGQYYQGLIDHTEQDEVAAGFAAYYRQMRKEYGDQPDDILWQMQRYVLGQEYSRWERADAADVVVTFFFEQCDIFEIPPQDWRPSEREGGKDDHTH